MKRLIAAAIILVFVFAVSITGNYTVHKYNKEVVDKVEDVLTATDENKEYYAEKFSKYWESIREKLAIFVNHEEINEIGRMATDLLSAAKSGDKEAIISHSNEIVFMINRIAEDENISLFSLL